MSTPTTSRSYRPGEWYAVLGADVCLLLPGSERARVAALWDVVDGGADLAETLDALVSSGLRDLPGFVLLDSGGDATRVLVRGAATVRFTTGEGTVEVDGREAATWVERTVAGVTATSVRVGAEEADAAAAAADGADDGAGAAGADRRIDEGLVRVGRLDLAAYDADGELRRAEPGVEPVTESVPTEPSDALTGPLLPPPPGAGAPPVVRLHLSDGAVVDVDRVVLLGRAPEARRFAPADQPRLVTVPSPQHEISATHLEIRPTADHEGAVVTDLGSTNGTVLVRPGLPPETLQPGKAVELLPGAVVDLGDGATIHVTAT